MDKDNNKFVIGKLWGEKIEDNMSTLVKALVEEGWNVVPCRSFGKDYDHGND